MPLVSYLDGIVDSWRRQRLNAQIDYSKIGTSPEPCILAEQTLSHALVNILNNAADVSPELVMLQARWEPERLMLRIIDQGPGIAPAISERLGKAPVSTKEQGLGVGLFLAFATIERMGGRIEMRAQPKGGTCTHIVLPLVPGAEGT